MKNVEKFQELTKMIFASSIAIKKDFEDILKEASGKRKAIDEAYNHNSKAYAEAVENAKKEKESKGHNLEWEYGGPLKEDTKVL